MMCLGLMLLLVINSILLLDGEGRIFFSNHTYASPKTNPMPQQEQQPKIIHPAPCMCARTKKTQTPQNTKYIKLQQQKPWKNPNHKY